MKLADKIKSKVKKELKNFLKDESGLMSKENILKVAIGSAAILGLIQAGNAEAGCSHSNSCSIESKDIGGGCYEVYTTHSNHCSHSSY